MLIGEAHDPGVGVGAPHRDAEALPGQHVAGGVGPAEVGRAAGAQPTVEALGAAQTELQHLVGAGRVADAGRLGADEGVEID